MNRLTHKHNILKEYLRHNRTVECKGVWGGPEQPRNLSRDNGPRGTPSRGDLFIKYTYYKISNV